MPVGSLATLLLFFLPTLLLVLYLAPVLLHTYTELPSSSQVRLVLLGEGTRQAANVVQSCHQVYYVNDKVALLAVIR